MKGRRSSRRSAGRSPGVMRMLSVVCLLAFATSCARDVTYLHQSDEIVHLTKGDPAPHDGWLLWDDHLAELYDLLEQKLANEDPPAD